MTLPPAAGVSARSGILLRRGRLPQSDVTSVKGYIATTVERTLADLSAGHSVAEIVVLADAATNARLTSISRLAATAEAYSGRRGVATFRRAVEFVEPLTESPMESRLRMVLVLAGLPRPIAQKSLHDASGRFLGRPDLYYPDAKLGIEYDGGTHRTTLVADNRRQNRLLEAGIRLLRFTAADIYNRPHAVVAEVRGFLG